MRQAPGEVAWQFGLHDLRLAGDGAGIGAVLAGFGAGIGVPGEDFGEVIYGGAEGGVPIELFAGVGGHAAKEGGHGAVGAVFGFAVGRVVADGGEEVVVLLLVGVLGAFGFVAPLVVAVDFVAAHIGFALRALDV